MLIKELLIMNSKELASINSIPATNNSKKVLLTMNSKELFYLEDEERVWLRNYFLNKVLNFCWHYYYQLLQNFHVTVVRTLLYSLPDRFDRKMHSLSICG